MQIFDHESDLFNEEADLMDNIWNYVVWKKPITNKKINIKVFQGSVNARQHNPFSSALFESTAQLKDGYSVEVEFITLKFIRETANLTPEVLINYLLAFYNFTYASRA